MDRERFEAMLEAYGAEFQRWPADVREAGEAFAVQDVEAAALVAEARALDRALSFATDTTETGALATRILATAPRRGSAFDARAALALAACAVFGVVLGYGGGLLAPVADQDDDYFADALGAPLVDIGDEG